MEKIKKLILSSFIIAHATAVTTVTSFANNYTNALEKTETIAPPEVVDKTRNLILNGADWVLGIGVAASFFTIVVIGVLSLKSSEEHDYTKSKKWATRIFVTLIIVLSAKKLIEFVVRFATA